VTQTEPRNRTESTKEKGNEKKKRQIENRGLQCCLLGEEERRGREYRTDEQPDFIHPGSSVRL
jgi:hypothetical protein